MVLKQGVMGNIIRLRTNNRRGGLPVAPGAAVRIYLSQVEASSEPTPGDIGCIEQVADVLATHLHLFATGAHIAEWIRVADHCNPAVPIRHQFASATDVFRNAIGLA